MGVLANIFGAGDVVKKGMDLVDSFHTSETEEIEAKTKAKTKLLESYAPFKIAQRILAAMFATIYLLTFIVLAIMTQAGIGDPEALKTLMQEFKIGWIMLTIVGFYFGGGAFEGITERRNEGKGK